MLCSDGDRGRMGGMRSAQAVSLLKRQRRVKVTFSQTTSDPLVCLSPDTHSQLLNGEVSNLSRTLHLTGRRLLPLTQRHRTVNQAGITAKFSIS